VGPTRVQVTRDGRSIAALDWGGDGPDLLFLHANGFCAGAFDPLARRLGDDFRPVAVDLRGHGGSDAPRDRADYALDRLAADVLAVVDALGLRAPTIVGESLGGTVAVMVDRLRPGLAAALLLCEAIVVEPGSDLLTRIPGLVEMALRRRAQWSSRDEVRRSYAGRPPFATFAPEALDAFLACAFVDRPDGTVELACAPAVEAGFFELTTTEEAGGPTAWRHLADLSAPVAVVHGRDSEMPDTIFEGQARRSGGALVGVDGGHLFLHEDLAQAEALVSTRGMLTSR
jgi:pimeloyl-ACP methyl ester carboxylesterase